MSVRFGFYNSLNGDRKYNAIDMSHIFDGIINDGVFMSIGTAFYVEPITGLEVNVGIGKAWLDHTWTWNDAVLPMTVDPADTILNRIDSIVLDINSYDNERTNQILLLKGSPATNPVKPTLINESGHRQYSIADIRVNRNTATLTQENITYNVGKAPLPFVTGILETIDTTTLIGQWQSQWNNWLLNTQSDTDDWINDFKDDMLTFQGYYQGDFLAWFQSMKDQLSVDAAGNLQNQITALTQTEFNRYYDLVQRITSIQSVSSTRTLITATSPEAVVTTNITTTSDTKTTITANVYPSVGNWQYDKTTTIDTSNASNIVVNESYLQNPK